LLCVVFSRSAIIVVANNRSQNVPSSIIPTLKPLIVSLICMVLFVVGSSKFPIMNPDDPQHNAPVWLLAGEPWLRRYMYQWVALFFVRQKYVAASETEDENEEQSDEYY